MTTARLRSDRDFVLFAIGQATSALGDSTRLVLMPLLVLGVTGSGTLMGVVAMLEALPVLVFGLPAGALVDRWNRQRVMVWTDAGRAALIGVIPLARVLELDTLTVVLIVAVPVGVLEQFFEAAVQASVPMLVGRARLAAANGVLHGLNAVGFVVGPVLATTLAVAAGADRAFAVDALSFVVSAATIAAVRRPLQDRRDAARASLFGDIRVGLRHIAATPGLRAVVVLRVLVVAITAPLAPVATYLLEHDLGLPSAIGWVMGAYCVGAIAGSIVASRLRPAQLGVARVLGSALLGAGLAGLALAGGHRAALLALAIATGAAFTTAQIAAQTHCALATPDALLGRVTSAVRVAIFSLTPLTLLLAGALLDVVGGRSVLLGMGAATAAVSAIFAATLRRTEAR